ncbi:hypothetical protein B0H14DRAFT_3476520 [Mycena olivaceomarginata]|nr:hypothetical protein B0H14DRAFT_3476520 [Mycena olivaceomarginata]
MACKCASSVRASAASPLPIQLAADDFRKTRVAWTGLTQRLDHPHLARWRDTEFLKKHLNYFAWDGRWSCPALSAVSADQCPSTSHAFVDAKGRVVGSLIGAPKDPCWLAVVSRATECLRREWYWYQCGAPSLALRRPAWRHTARAMLRTPYALRAQNPARRSVGGGSESALEVLQMRAVILVKVFLFIELSYRGMYKLAQFCVLGIKLKYLN